GLDAGKINDYLNKKSGMLGISGVSSDLRDIIAAADSGHEKARLALAIFCNRVKAYIGNYLAKLNSCDCLVFTAGIGENGCGIRETICSDMENIGIKMDADKNKVRGQQVDVSAAESKVKIFVIPTNEELVIARDTLKLTQ
ncbi:MAG: acetate kinase, partial [Firmicutes bacterium]|nr:acetate kinase [Bacillota bacterium]